MTPEAPSADWPVRKFAVWWLRAKPLAVPQDSGAVRYYDGFAGITLYRQPPFQVQLFVVRPNGMSPWHAHPNIDSVEYGLAGDGIGTFRSERSAHAGPLILIEPSEGHEAGSGPAGGCFFSIQKWLNGVAPSSVELDWTGPSIDDTHHTDLGRPLAPIGEHLED